MYSRLGVMLAALVLLTGVVASPAVLAQERERNVDVGRLPIDLDRIQRGLQESADREEHEGLNLRYVIQVYGQSPAIVLFGLEDNLTTGPVPYGAPTHKEMIDHVTPQEFRAPAADLSALMRWLAERAKK